MRWVGVLFAAAVGGSCLSSGVAHAGDSDKGPDAVVPGELTAAPTVLCIGLYLPVEGDANGNATASVEFRKVGTDEWKKALPLWRVVPQKVDIEAGTVGGMKVTFLGGLRKWNKGTKDLLVERYSRNYLAGSIFDLKPAAKYEIKATLSDPDGGGTTKTIEAMTRAVSAIPKQGNAIEVKGGGAALPHWGARPEDR